MGEPEPSIEIVPPSTEMFPPPRSVATPPEGGSGGFAESDCCWGSDCAEAWDAVWGAAEEPASEAIA